jgi:hypothetical protein
VRMGSRTDWLGYWLTPGTQTMAKKMQAILNMQAPVKSPQLRSFIGSSTTTAICVADDTYARPVDQTHPAPSSLYGTTSNKQRSRDHESNHIVKPTLSPTICHSISRLTLPTHQLGAVIKQNSPLRFTQTQFRTNELRQSKRYSSVVETLKVSLYVAG